MHEGVLGLVPLHEQDAPGYGRHQVALVGERIASCDEGGGEGRGGGRGGVIFTHLSALCSVYVLLCVTYRCSS